MKTRNPAKFPRAGAPALVSFASGHSIEAHPATSRFTLRNPSGRVELQVRCSPAGVTLEFESSEVELVSSGALTLACQDLRLQAQRTLDLRSEGDLSTVVAGSSITQVSGTAELSAAEVSVCAQRGDLALTANDDVRVQGESILLNSEHGGSLASEEMEAFWRTWGC